MPLSTTYWVPGREEREPPLYGRWAATWAAIGAVLLLLTFAWPSVEREVEGDDWVRRVSWFWERPVPPWDVDWNGLGGTYLAPALGLATLAVLAGTRGRARSILLVALPALVLAAAQTLGPAFDHMQFDRTGNLLFTLGVCGLLVGNRVRRSHPRSRLALGIAGVGALAALVPMLVTFGPSDRSTVSLLLDPATWSRSRESYGAGLHVVSLGLELLVVAVGLLSFLPGDRPIVRGAIAILGWLNALPVTLLAGIVLDGDLVPENLSLLVRYGWGFLVPTLLVLGVGVVALLDDLLRTPRPRAVPAIA